jgi:periplasmic protein TonB
MPHALLLSPDDQAVSAITGVLEEMSVTCERPLDGASAAQKLNSQSFDLVLVDCENLAAAKLIFDVCRRGKTGNTPVPIAIVDGRAGLPTAFRLGAELILTKPVAKDQARSTVRNAVNRIRKDAAKSESIAAPPASVVTADAAPSATMPPVVAETEELKQAAAAGVSSQLTSYADPDPGFVSASVPDPASATLPAPTLSENGHSAVAQDEIGIKPASAKLTLPSAFFATSRSSESSPAPAASVKSEPSLTVQPSGEPVLAELGKPKPKSKQEAWQPPKATPNRLASEVSAADSSSYPQARKQTRLLAALLMLTLAAGGCYAAWTYQPGFRALAQPQIHRLLVLGGMAQPRTPETSPAKPVKAAVPSTTPVRVSGSSTHPAQIQGRNQRSAAGPATAFATVSPATLVAASAPVQPPATPNPVVAPPLTTVTNTPAPVAVKLEVNQPSTLEKDTAATVSHTPLPGEDGAILLSSQGAEKRLLQSVPPNYPADARLGEAKGTVVLKEVVDETGKVAGVRLVEGDATLAAAAIKAVKQWRYRPYVRDGQAQPFQTVVIIDFQRP